MIFVDNLTKYFDTFLAVDHVSFSIQAGEVLILLGPNGAGKTTTVRMLTSILRPSEGIARVGGFDVVRNADKVRASVGVLTEQHGLYSRMNSIEYLDFYGKMYGMRADQRKKKSSELLEFFGLIDARKKRLGEYSKGMRQKLALVRALMHDPQVLLLDEPTSAMDPESASLVREAIKGLRSSERTTLICTHNLAEAEELADQLAIIKQGKLLFNGPTRKLKDQQLGFPVFQATFAEPVIDEQFELPRGVSIHEKTEYTITFKVETPIENNPILISRLSNSRGRLISFQEVPRSLEAAYLKALSPQERLK